MILAGWRVGRHTIACCENRVVEVIDELEVVEGFAVGRSVNVWAVVGGGREVVNVDGLGEHWENSIVKKEGRRGSWIACVEVIAHDWFAVAGRESKQSNRSKLSKRNKLVCIAGLAENALQGPNARRCG